MYNIVLNGVTKRNDYAELIREFLPEDQFEIYALEKKTQGEYISQEELDSISEGLTDKLTFDFNGDKNALKRDIYRSLSDITARTLPWGILTGVRPVKLVGQLDDPETELRVTYLVSEEKIREAVEIYDYQQTHSGVPERNSVGIYIGIPFCPSRCQYCSFTSNEPKGDSVERYLNALITEISSCGSGKWIPESIYIGGGTPTTLNEEQLDRLLTCIDESFDLKGLKEYSVEAGRPDTITPEKLAVLKKHGVGRISINPQTMKEETLELIGRRHNIDMVKKAFAMSEGFTVNADVIAGLPEETLDDFINTIEELTALGADNITIHSLAVKRASRLNESDPDFHRKRGETVAEMIETGDRLLREKGYVPYYLYRQKHMSGSLENVGYCKDDTYCLYNIRIMEEKQSILAFGAGGVSKIYYPDEDRHERAANVSNYEIYIDRIDDMIKRKELFYVD